MATSVSYIILKFGTLPRAHKIWVEASYNNGQYSTVSDEDYFVLNDFFNDMTFDERLKFIRTGKLEN